MSTHNHTSYTMCGRHISIAPSDGLKLLYRLLRLIDYEVVGLVELLVYFPIIVIGERLLRVESPMPNFFLFLCQPLLLVCVMSSELGVFF